jgi:EmrB/QacA subfamily drug resistance transporter
LSEQIDPELHWGTAQARWVVAATVAGSGIVMLDATVVNVALPRLGADLDANFAGLQWVVTGYTLTLASLILVGGSLGDRYGRRRIYLFGIIWFVVASAMCALAPTLGVLIAARLLQGVGGALLTPGSLAILEASFAPSDRSRAIGAWSGLGGIAAAVGPLLGGWLVEVASWRWIFVINIPVGVAVVMIVLAHVPESSGGGDAARRSDYLGAALVSVSLATLTYSLIEKQWWLAAIGAVLLAAFVLHERRSADPMLPLQLFHSRQFSATNAVTFIVYGALSMVLFLLALMLQLGLGYSPVGAGAALLPITAVMFVFSARSGALAQRIGPRVPMSLGPMLMAGGLLLMMRVNTDRSYVGAVLPALLVFATGLVLMVAPLTATALASAGSERAGIASGVNNAVARVGGLLAVAAVPIIASFDPESSVDPGQLTSGFHTAAAASAGLCVLGGALAWVFIQSDALAEESRKTG